MNIWILQFIFHCKRNWRPCLSSSLVNIIRISEISIFSITGLCSRISGALWISIIFYLFWLCLHITASYIYPHLVNSVFDQIGTSMMWTTMAGLNKMSLMSCLRRCDQTTRPGAQVLHPCVLEEIWNQWQFRSLAGHSSIYAQTLHLVLPRRSSRATCAASSRLLVSHAT